MSVAECLNANRRTERKISSLHCTLGRERVRYNSSFKSFHLPQMQFKRTPVAVHSKVEAPETQEKSGRSPIKHYQEKSKKHSWKDILFPYRYLRSEDSRCRTILGPGQQILGEPRCNLGDSRYCMLVSKTRDVGDSQISPWYTSKAWAVQGNVGDVKIQKSNLNFLFI